MIIAILQARTGSSRLPAKVLRKIREKTLLELYINRVRKSKLIDKIVIATTSNPEDDIIENIAADIKVGCFRGSENDLIDRFWQCACKYGADIVVRLTADDPFVDPEVIDHAIGIFKENNADFVTNHFDPSYPEGLDTEVYSISLLEKAWKEAELLSEREHVFPYVENHREELKVINFKQEKDYSHLRWTIDHECDYQMTKTIYDYLYDGNPVFLQDDILQLLEKHPEISEMNNHIKRKEGVNKTKANDMIMERPTA